MKIKPFYMMTLLLITIGLSACGSNPEKLVKTGTLQIDASVTVGDVFNGYQFFGNKSWKAFKDPQNREVVEFNGSLDFDKFVGSEMQGVQLTAEMIENAKKKLKDFKTTYEAQFAISKDGKTFELKYSGVKISGTNLASGEPVDKDLPDNNSLMLHQIYGNKPEPSTWGLLFSAGN